MKVQVNCIFILFCFTMTIRVVILSRWDLGGFNANAFLFYTREDAITYAQELLSDEYEQNELREEDFRQKSDEYIKYIDDFGTYGFEILVEPKQISK